MKLSFAPVAFILVPSFVRAATRVPFGSFQLSFQDVACGEQSWKIAEKVRSGAEDCLRAFECNTWVGDDQPYFIGLGNAECEDDLVSFRGGVMQFAEGSEIPVEIESCVRAVLTSGACTSIFQGYLPGVDQAPIYSSDRVSSTEISEDDDSHDELAEGPASIKSMELPIVPMAAASAGTFLLIVLSAFIVFRKKRLSSDGFTNLSNSKVVPVSSTMSTTEVDVEMGASLTGSDSLMKRSPPLGDMLDRISGSKDDDCADTPDTWPTKVSSNLGSDTFSDDEEDHQRQLTDGRLSKASLSQHSYDTRFVVDSSDDEQDHEDYPVIAIPSFETEADSSQAELMPPSRLFGIDVCRRHDSERLSSEVPPGHSRFRSFSNSTENKTKTLEQDDGFVLRQSNSWPNIQSGFIHDGNVLPPSDDEVSEDDPELVFFNEQVKGSTACLAVDNNCESDSVLELVTESSSVGSDDREFAPDLYWNPDDTSVTSVDVASVAFGGTGEFSFHPNASNRSENTARKASSWSRPLADWSLEAPSASKFSAASLPTVCQKYEQPGNGVNHGRRRRSLGYPPLQNESS